jgi:hypothetical protein
MRKSITNKAGKAGKTIPSHPIRQSGRLSLSAATPGVSTRDYVYQCLAAQATPGSPIYDDTILNTIPNVAVGPLARCLNESIPLVDNNAWDTGGPGGIQSGWTVDTLTTRTDYRRKHP